MGIARGSTLEKLKRLGNGNLFPTRSTGRPIDLNPIEKLWAVRKKGLLKRDSPAQMS